MNRAAKEVGCSEIGIRNCLKGIQKTCGGYKWELYGYGRKQPSEWCKEKKKVYEEARRKKKLVYQFSLDGTLMNIWGSTKEASQGTGIDVASIYYGIHNKYNYSHGYRWSKQDTVRPLTKAELYKVEHYKKIYNQVK